MSAKRTIEVFSAGCPVCDAAVKAVNDAACPSCDVQVLDMQTDSAAQAKAKQYGIQRVPAVVIDGKLAECCADGGIDVAMLRQLGLGQS
jgi:glutaredoxin 3